MSHGAGGTARPAAVRLYAALLRLLPSELRHAHGGDATDVFHDMYEDARAHGRWRAWRLLGWAVVRLLSCAAGDRRRERAVTARRASLSPPGQPAVRHKELSEMLTTIANDLRYAARTLAGKPAFALSAILILAVGIGATTTIFSVVDAVVLRPLPYPEAEDLVFFSEGSHNFPDVNEWLTRLTAFETLAVSWDERFDLTDEGGPEQIDGARVNEGFFEVFGATPYRGRLFEAGEFRGEPAVVVLSHGVWQRRWGGDPGLIGRPVTIDGRPLVVAGVLGPGFEPPEIMVGNRADVYLPLEVDDPEHRDDRGFHVLSVAGRLRDAAALQVAQEQMDAFTAERAEEFPERYVRDGEPRRVPLLPLRQATVESVSATLYLLLGAVGFMLLISCANVANLFLARGTERSREIALRGALGAGRRRIAAQLLTESVGLAVVGGVAGIVIAFGGVSLFARLNPGNLPRLHDVTVDMRILAFALFASLATGALFGILPALQAARADVNETLKAGAANVTTGRRGRRTRGALVVAEIALALVLLVGAGLLLRSLVATLQVDPGFETANLVDVSLQLGPVYTAEERRAFTRDLLERVAALPGTEASAAGWTLPFVYFGGGRCCWRTTARDATGPALDEPIQTMVHPVTAGYFEMLGAPLRRGRGFVAADESADPPPAIINGRIAEEVFGTDDVVGRGIALGDQELVVVGVVDGVAHYGLREGVDNAVYVPFARFGAELPLLHVGVRSTAALEPLVAALREAVWDLRPDQPINEIVTMRERVSRSVAAPRFLSALLGGFAGVALLLACGGIYGSMLYSVGRRRREMGIRLALGAAGHNVVGMVLGQGLVLTALGLGIGVAGALALSRLMENLLWGIEPTDAATFVVVSGLLALAALAACLVPAFKAARADPLQTLRAD